jgi:hypothetical protein
VFGIGGVWDLDTMEKKTEIITHNIIVINLATLASLRKLGRHETEILVVKVQLQDVYHRLLSK